MKKLIREYNLKPSGYPNVTFGDGVVGSRSKPSTDNTNPELLKDVSKAAQKAGVEVTITTAKTGHTPKGRHLDDDAVDIAMVNGLGFSGGKSDAQKKGIYNDIMSFVSALESMGYKKNTESGNEKAVLTFGFPGHDNHVHVSKSRKVKGSVSSSEPSRKAESTSLMKGATFKIIAKPSDHAKRPLNNWQSDNAWDIKAAIGTPVHSLTKGKVTKVHESSPNNPKIYGTQVTIEGLDGFPTVFYTHLKNVKLTKNQTVYPGDYIGQITRWNTNPDASHVHIGINGNSMVLYELMDSSGNLKSVSSSSDKEFNLSDLSTDKINNVFGPGKGSKGTSFIDIFTTLGNILKPDKEIKEDVDRIKDIMKKIL